MVIARPPFPDVADLERSRRRLKSPNSSYTYTHMLNSAPSGQIREERKERIMKLKKMIDERGNKSYRQVMGSFSLETGNTKIKSFEYLEVLIDAGLVKPE